MRVLVAIILAILLGGSVLIIKTAYENRPAVLVKATSNIRSTIGPDISHCFNEAETRELWDCIRHEN